MELLGPALDSLWDTHLIEQKDTRVTDHCDVCAWRMRVAYARGVCARRMHVVYARGVYTLEKKQQSKEAFSLSFATCENCAVSVKMGTEDSSPLTSGLP